MPMQPDNWLDTATDKEKEDWCHYGIIPGPLFDSCDVTTPEEYVCSFEMNDWRVVDGKRECFTAKYDLYVVSRQSELGQSYVLRHSGDDAADYGSGPIDTLFTITHKPWAQALHILCCKGRFTWSNNHI